MGSKLMADPPDVVPRAILATGTEAVCHLGPIEPRLLHDAATSSWYLYESGSKECHKLHSPPVGETWELVVDDGSAGNMPYLASETESMWVTGFLEAVRYSSPSGDFFMKGDQTIAHVDHFGSHGNCFCEVPG